VNANHFANTVQSTAYELYGKHAGTIYHSVCYHNAHIHWARL